MNATTKRHGSIALREAIIKAAPIVGALAVNAATTIYLLRTDSPHGEIFPYVTGAISIISAQATGFFATPINWIGSNKGDIISNGVAAAVIAGDLIAVLLRVAN